MLGYHHFKTKRLEPHTESAHLSSVGMQYAVTQRYNLNPKDNVVVALFEYRAHAEQSVHSFENPFKEHGSENIYYTVDVITTF
jgi:hypothetical protein